MRPYKGLHVSCCVRYIYEFQKEFPSWNSLVPAEELIGQQIDIDIIIHQRNTLFFLPPPHIGVVLPFWSLLTLPTGSSLYDGHILPPLDDHSGGLNPCSNGRCSASYLSGSHRYQKGRS